MLNSEGSVDREGGEEKSWQTSCRASHRHLCVVHGDGYMYMDVRVLCMYLCMCIFVRLCVVQVLCAHVDLCMYVCLCVHILVYREASGFEAKGSGEHYWR